MITPAEIASCQIRNRDMLEAASRERLIASAARSTFTGRPSRTVASMFAGLRHLITSLVHSPERRSIRGAALEQHG